MVGGGGGCVRACVRECTLKADNIDDTISKQKRKHTIYNKQYRSFEILSQISAACSSPFATVHELSKFVVLHQYGHRRKN